MLKSHFLILATIFFFIGCAQKQVSDLGKDDPRLWLEEVEGEKALNWVSAQNKKSMANLASKASFKDAEKKALKIYESKDKIPQLSIRGEYIYNYWQDSKHVRGVWRRVPLDKYRSKNTKWDVLLDLDKLAKSEKENWVFKEVHCLPPTYNHCLLQLSRGGKDATVVREFNVKTKSFVKGGFYLKEAKSRVAWLNDKQIFVSTDFGKGSLSDSGYPRILKLWTRGTDLSKAKLVFEIAKKSLMVVTENLRHGSDKLVLVKDWTTFFTSKRYLYDNGDLTPLPIQDSAEVVGLFKTHLLLKLRKDWNVSGKSFKAGSLVALPSDRLKNKKLEKTGVALVLAPQAQSSILDVEVLKDSILVNTLEKVRGQIYQITMGASGFNPAKAMSLVKGQYHLTLAAASSEKNQFFFTDENFINPQTLYSYNPKKQSARKLQSLPQQFNSRGMIVEQRWVTSKDGTQVPYFVVGKKSVLKKGKAPTLLYGYGGFEVAYTPRYNPVVGKLWLEKGGVYVVANIRGGGEFGPAWHQAALKKNRHKAYDDFIAVGEDLIAKGTTIKDKLAIQGGSNGGLLVGAVMTRRPDLFESVVCLVPLLDMIRYTQLLAGASWAGEYGDPIDPDIYKYIMSYSPYQNVSADKKYPNVFFMTSTKDDRVHPGHARKMAHKMMEQGHPNIHYYENTEGGHAATANLKQKAKMRALIFEFLYQTLL